VLDDGVILRSQANLVASARLPTGRPRRARPPASSSTTSAARARARKYREVRTRFAGCDAALLAEAHNRFGVVSPFGGPTSSGMVTLHCPPAQLYRACELPARARRADGFGGVARTMCSTAKTRFSPSSKRFLGK